MKTRTINAFKSGVSPGFTADSTAPIDPEAIAEAARHLSAGDVVAIPTETVYGLAANALDANAVAKIFEAKGRPATNPLIVHVESVEQARQLVETWPESAEILASAFWPGPLTLVLPRKVGLVPDITTAGSATVAIRCPRHPIALGLIQRCGFPLAAPSANRSNALSPTTAAHVENSLGGRIPLILDGGPCSAGIESTVLDLTSTQPRILRPGVLSSNFLSEILQTRVLDPEPGATSAADSTPALSPGRMAVHYAPDTPLFLVESPDMPTAVEAFTDQQKMIAVVGLGDSNLRNDEILRVSMPQEPGEYARYIYATLHQLDGEALDAILCEMPPRTPEWLAVNDRLIRAGNPWEKGRPT